MGIVSIQRFGEYAILGIWQITESIDELLLNVNLTDLDKAILKKKRTDSKKKEWLACRNILKAITDESPQISYDIDGKPFLKDDIYNISMSHSATYAAVYLNKNSLAGVDIQKIKPSISAGADFFLNDDELNWADIQNNLQMHLIWSAKEAAFKYSGLNELDFKKDIRLKPFRGNQNELIEVNIFNRGTVTTIRIGYSLFEQYVLTWTI